MKKKLKIIIFDGTFKTTTFINRLAKGLATKHEVYIVGFNEKVNQKLSGVKYLGLGSNNSISNLIFRSIQCRNWKVAKLFSLLKAILIGNRKKIQKENLQFIIENIKPDILHFQWVSVLSYFEDLVLPTNTKTILSQRGFHINVRPFVNEDNFKFLYRVFQEIDGFHSVSEAIKDNSNKIYKSPNKIDKVVYSGFKFENLPTKKSFQLSETLQILSVGRGHWKKDYRTALFSISLLIKKGIQCHYTIIGIDNNEELLYLVNDLNLKGYVTFISKVSQKEVYEKMIRSDIFLLPSIEEGIANVCIESMFCKLPVISTDCGGMSELIDHKKTGFLAPVFDSEAMAKSVIELKNMSPKEIEKLCDLARKKVEIQHSSESMIKGMEDLYLQLHAES